MVERWTVVVAKADIHRSLVQIRLEGLFATVLYFMRKYEDYISLSIFFNMCVEIHSLFEFVVQPTFVQCSIEARVAQSVER